MKKLIRKIRRRLCWHDFVCEFNDQREPPEEDTSVFYCSKCGEGRFVTYFDEGPFIRSFPPKRRFEESK